MTSDFAGSTARYYRHFRRDVCDAILDDLCQTLSLTSSDCVLDLGCGTGQVAVPLAGRVRAVIAVDPEPDMLAQLDARITDCGITNITSTLGSDRDLRSLLNSCEAGKPTALTVATALQWMSAEDVFRTACDQLPTAGGVAVITQGTPIWLQDSDWSRDLRNYLESWLGPLTATCGTDRQALEQRYQLMRDVGFKAVQLFDYTDHLDIDLDYVIGNLYSAMSDSTISSADQPLFERGLRAALRTHVVDSQLIERVDATLLVGHV
jgi:SAM-dependent methyltransferase